MIINLKDWLKIFVHQLANKNQFVIEYNNHCDSTKTTNYVFQSYRSIIAIYNPETKTLLLNWHKWDYSKTTLKHLKLFINEWTCYRYENKQQFINLIKQKDFILFSEE